LIEVKIANFSIGVRAGDPKSVEDIRDRFNQARKQINFTFDKLQEDHEALRAIPRDRPFFGLFVTATNFHMANGSNVTNELLPTKIPVLTISLRDLEHFVANDATDLGNAIEAVLSDLEKRTWPAHTSIGEYLEAKSNSITEEVASQIPMLAWVEKITEELKPEYGGAVEVE
jgi:hypothetical protein